MTYKKGTEWTGNRRGRPLKGLTIADLFAAEGDLIYDKKSKTSKRQKLIAQIYDNAILGDPAFARLCIEREYGKSLEMVEISDKRKPLDLSKLSDKKLIELQKLLKEAEPDVPDPEQD
jgi:hypothetical protein